MRRLVILLVAIAGFVAAAGGAMIVVSIATDRAPMTPPEPPDDDLAESLASADTAAWVERYEPRRCANGYNLILYGRRLPVLIDMNGRVVHSWPHVRAVGRVRLTARGSLLAIGRDDAIWEFDWDGSPRFVYQLPTGHLPHHDLIELDNGNLLVLAQDEDRRDYVVEVDRRGRVKWEWWAHDHLGAIDGYNSTAKDPSHINSVHELGPNRWFDRGDHRFRPGNFLLSVRNLDTIVVVDRSSGDILWQYREGLDRQHEAVMVPADQVGEGLVVVFNNGLEDRYGYRKSSVVAIDPVARDVRWRYADPTFYSSVSGTAEPQPNGNVLITSSEGGRLFEVDVLGRLVWQLIPDYLPMRVHRYAADHCPQLEALGEPVGRPVRRPSSRWIDAELYAYLTPPERVNRRIEGQRIPTVREPSSCRRLWLPAIPSVVFEYGLNADRLRPDEDLRVTFSAVLESLGADTGWKKMVLFEDHVASSSDQLWRTRTAGLGRHGHERVRLCLKAAWDGQTLGAGRARQLVIWKVPKIVTPSRTALQERPDAVGAAEREAREKQLRALGYVQ